MTHHTPLALLGESTVVDLLLLPHTHADTNTGVTPSLVSPGDSNFTTKPTGRKVRGEEKLKEVEVSRTVEYVTFTCVLYNFTKVHFTEKYSITVIQLL